MTTPSSVTDAEVAMTRSPPPEPEAISLPCGLPREMVSPEMVRADAVESKMRKGLAKLVLCRTVRTEAPGPVMVRGSLMVRLADVRLRMPLKPDWNVT